MEGEGFEPSKAMPSDLQSDPFGRSGIPPKIYSWQQESNLRPTDYKSVALPTELCQRFCYSIHFYPSGQLFDAVC